VTNDSFDKVASWYHDQLPADWKQTRLDDMAKVSRQVSKENIGKLLHSYATGMPAGSDTSMPADTSSAPPGPSFAGFSAPDNDPHHRKTVIVMTRPGEPTMVITSRVVQP
jgi:hypothetical protein